MNDMFKKRKNYMSLSEWELYENSPEFKSFEKRLERIHEDCTFTYKTEVKTLKDKHNLGEFMEDNKFAKIFNDDFEHSNKFFAILSEYLTFSIRELNHLVFQKLKDNGGTVITKSEESLIKILSCIVFLYAITIINVQYFGDFIAFAKKVNFEHIMSEINNQITVSFLKNLRKSIYDLNV